MRFWQFMMIVVVFRPVEVLMLLSYNYLVPLVLENATVFEIILIINVAIIDLVLLFLYYKTIIRLFKKYTAPIASPFKKPVIKSEAPCDCAPAPIQDAPPQSGGKGHRAQPQSSPTEPQVPTPPNRNNRRKTPSSV